MLRELDKALNRQGKRLVKEVRRSIKKKKMVVSGSLYESVRYELEEIDEGEFVMRFYMFDYGYYQDEGVKGANPSKISGGKQKAPRSRFKFGSGMGKGSLFKALDKWIVQKGEFNRQIRDKRGRFMSRKALRYAMTKSIYFQGIEPKEFFTPVYEKWERRLPSILSDALAKDVEQLWFELVKK
jgi:hypothetical protein